VIYVELGKKSQLAQGTVVRTADNDVVKHLDFQELTGPDQLACHLDVGFGRLNGLLIHGQA